MGCSSGNVDSPRADVLEEQNVMVLHPLRRPDLLGEEVAGPHGIDVGSDEFMPRAVAPVGLRIESMGAHDVADRGSRHLLAQSQLPQFAMNARFTPAVQSILGGHTDDQAFDGFWGHWSPTDTPLLPGAHGGLTLPSLERRAGDDQEKVGDELPQVFLGRQQFASLGGRHADRSIDAVLEDADLQFQELDDRDQLADIADQDELEEAMAVNGAMCWHDRTLRDGSMMSGELLTPAVRSRDDAQRGTPRNSRRGLWPTWSSRPGGRCSARQVWADR